MTKKVLSLVLALVLVLSMTTGVMLTASAASVLSGQLPSGQFVVAEFNFENGLDGFQALDGSKVELVEENGNKYISVKPALSAEEITTYTYAGGGAPGEGFWNMGFDKQGLSIPADTTKTYFFKINAKLEAGSKYYQDQSIMSNNLGSLYAGNWYESMLDYSGSTKTGWTGYMSNWYLNTTTAEDGTFSSIQLKSNIAKELCLAMAETATYAGEGLGTWWKWTNASYMMTINGASHAFNKDCSAIGDTPAVKAARLADFLQEKPLGYNIDDIQLITTGVTTRAINVNIWDEWDGSASGTPTATDVKATIVANPYVSNGTYSNIGHGVSANDGTVTINNYYDTVITVDGKLKRANFAGNELEIINGNSAIIPKDKITNGYTLHLQLDSDLTVDFDVTGASYTYSVDGGEASSAASAKIASGSSVKLMFAPESGKVVNSVSYNGTSYPVVNNEVTLTITESGTVEAVAEDIAVVLPVIKTSSLGTTSNNYTYNEVTGKSAIIYINLDLGYGYDISETGCILIAGDNEIALKNNSGSNDSFGIRAISNAFEYGTVYKFRPYIKVASQPDVFGDDATFTFTE